ncbi:MAG: DASS family sodium-coupled anion symporter [Rhodospirillales bacterium]|nr:DASS family sodium-coupled anion symporter [Rhodospirillales bacterium]
MDIDKIGRTPLEQLMFYFGIPAGLVVFGAIMTMPTPLGIAHDGQVAMAVFALALILWVSKAVPNHVASLIVLILLSVLGGWSEKNALGVFGYDVIWLMVAAFVITSALAKSGFARRLALWLITTFGRTASSILLSMLIANFLIAFLVPSTTARAAIMLPIMLMVAHAYGVNEGNANMGKLLAIQGLQANNISTTAILTATAPQIMAVGLMKDLAGIQVSYTDWLVASAPIAVLTLLGSFFLGRFMYPPENVGGTVGGLDRLHAEYRNLGRLSAMEIKALTIFALTIGLWVTDKWHVAAFGFNISLVMVAVIAATLFFLPKVGILDWKEADIPWNLMIFSAGAYAGGLALDGSGVASWALNGLFASLGVTSMSFPVLFAVIMLIGSFSHFFFTSKVVRTVILIPTVIALAKATGINPIALALPVAFTLSDTITLPPHCKPNLIYYGSGFFSVLDQLFYGIGVLLIKWGLMLVASFTLFKVLDIT